MLIFETGASIRILNLIWYKLTCTYSELTHRCWGHFIVLLGVEDRLQLHI